MTDINTLAALITDGKLQEAYRLANALLQREPTNAGVLFLKGVACSRLGDNAEAITWYNQALQYKPDFREAALNLGHALDKAGKMTLAIRMFEHLLRIDLSAGTKKPLNSLSSKDAQTVDTWLRKGKDFHNKGDPASSADALRKALELQPNMPEALASYGIALHLLYLGGEAETVLLHALHQRPDDVETLNVLASNYAVMSAPLRGIAVWRQIIATRPDYYDAILNLAKAYSSLRLYDEAIQFYEQALSLRPQSAEILMELLHMVCRFCLWDKAAEITAKFPELLKHKEQWMEQFLVSVQLPELQLENARRYIGKFHPSMKSYDPKRPLPQKERGGKKLHIGYMSSDFYQHATTYLISEMFEQHDKERFEIVAYSHGMAEAGAERNRIAQAVTKFRDISQISDIAVIDLMRKDGIDILVDLKGHTSGNRFRLLTMRPAPLQMHYLGHPGTIGAPCIDYFIADHISAPPGADKNFFECLIRLPHSYQINDRKRPLPESVPPRSAYGLPEQGFVFCAFNNAYKITSEIFMVWMRLLAAVPGSVLWLFESNSEATANMRSFAQEQGIDPMRIIPAKHATLAYHLMRYKHADLFVDTFPVCGHTTASDALWCGVPVVTMAGDMFISRVAASLLHAVELPQLVTTNLADYETLALELAQNPEKLAGLKRHLEEGRLRFPLFDSAATTRALEAAYVHAAELHRAHKAPEAFSLSSDLKIEA